MREALKGQVVAGLPTGGWRSESLNMGLPASLWPQPEAPQAQPPREAAGHLDTSNPGAPVVVAGHGAQVQSDRQFDREDEPTPPGDIPENDGRRPRPPRDDRNFLEKLFGGE